MQHARSLLGHGGIKPAITREVERARMRVDVRQRAETMSYLLDSTLVVVVVIVAVVVVAATSASLDDKEVDDDNNDDDDNNENCKRLVTVYQQKII